MRKFFLWLTILSFFSMNIVWVVDEFIGWEISALFFVIAVFLCIVGIIGSLLSGGSEKLTELFDKMWF